MNSRDMFEQFASLHGMSVLKVGDAYSNDDTNYDWWIWQKALSISSDTNYEDLIKQAVNRFLGWKLPIDFNPDCNINFYRQYEPDSPHYPIGTNLFTAEQAKAMFEYCLSAYKPQAEKAIDPSVERALCESDATIYGRGYMLNGERIPPQDLLIFDNQNTRTKQADDVRKDAWISVDDRLPPMGEVVLVYGVTIGQAFDEWVTYHECPVSFSTITVETGEGWSEHEFEEVTHWQPLPAPPLDKARE